MPKERVQKILARSGIASRRKAEALIAEGAVTINGKVAKLGDHATYGKDSIKVAGKLLHSTESLAYLMFNKPRSVISMFGDPQGRPSLQDYLGQVKYRLFPVGRLDYNSEGLILLTNDGDFAEKIQRREDIIRVYHVKVGTRPTPEALARLEKGGRVGTRGFKPQSVRLAQEFTKKAMVEVTMVGSGAVDLKAYFESKGIQTERIIRVAFGHLRVAGIEPGQFKYLKASQAFAVLEQPELGVKRQDYESAKSQKKLDRVDRISERFAAQDQAKDEARNARRLAPIKPRSEKRTAPFEHKPMSATRAPKRGAFEKRAESFRQERPGGPRRSGIVVKKRPTR